MASFSGEIRAGRAFVEIYAKEALSRGLQAAQMRLRAFGMAAVAIGAPIQALGASIITGLFGSAMIFGKIGSAAYEMSQRTGISAEAVSELGFAAAQTETDVVALEAGIKFMQRTIAQAADGSGTAQAKLADLGVTLEQLSGLKPDQQFERMADALSKIEDPAQRTQAAMAIFGRGGAALIPLLRLGESGIAKLRQECRDLGLVISDEAAAKADLFMDTLSKLWSVVKFTAVSIGAAIAPIFTEWAAAGVRAVAVINAFIGRHAQLVRIALAVGVGLFAVGGALVAIGTAAIFSGLAISGIVTTFGALAGILSVLLSPIALVIAGVAAMAFAILHHTGAGAAALQWLGQKFQLLGAFVQDVVRGIADALTSGSIELAAQVLMAGLNVAWQTGANAVKGIWFNLMAEIQAAAVDAVFALQGIWSSLTGFMGKLIGGVVRMWIAPIRDIIDGLASVADWVGLHDMAAGLRRSGAVFEVAATVAGTALEHAGVGDEAAQIEARDLALAGIEDDRLANIAGAQADLDKAKKELADAQLAAAAPKALDDLMNLTAFGVLGRGEGGGPVTPANFSTALGDGIAKAAADFSARGTFNASPGALLSLKTGDVTQIAKETRDAAERTADAAEETAANTANLQPGLPVV